MSTSCFSFSSCSFSSSHPSAPHPSSSHFSSSYSCSASCSNSCCSHLFFSSSVSSPIFSTYSYRRGSICHISMKNWMSYGSIVTLTPSSGVNLIAAANGCGKSSIVCAICIGLGFSPKILGRSDNLKSFIKRGCTNAQIVIELYDESDNDEESDSEKEELGDNKYMNFKTLKITRQLQIVGQENNNILINQNNSSYSSASSSSFIPSSTSFSKTVRTQWYINDKSAKLEDILKIHKKYNLQVNNLVSFLPQEKVSDFSRMSPSELFIATLKAIDENMYKQYETIIELCTNKRDTFINLNTLKSKKGFIEENLKELKCFVEQLEKQKSLLYETKLCDTRILEINLKNCEEELQKKEKELKEIKEKLKNYETESIPLKEDMVKIEQQIKNFIKQEAKTRTKFKNLKIDSKNYLNKLSEYDRKISEEINNFELIEDSVSAWKKERNELLEKCTKTKAEILRFEDKLSEEKKKKYELNIMNKSNNTDSLSNNTEYEELYKNLSNEQNALRNEKSALTIVYEDSQILIDRYNARLQKLIANMNNHLKKLNDSNKNNDTTSEDYIYYSRLKHLLSLCKNIQLKKNVINAVEEISNKQKSNNNNIIHKDKNSLYPLNFKYVPLGPLGCLVKIKNKKYGGIVEDCIKSKIFSFICENNEGDMHLLSSIINVPSLCIPKKINNFCYVDENMKKLYNINCFVHEIIHTDNICVKNVLANYCFINSIFIVDFDNNNNNNGLSEKKFREMEIFMFSEISRQLGVRVNKMTYYTNTQKQLVNRSVYDCTNMYSSSVSYEKASFFNNYSCVYTDNNNENAIKTKKEEKCEENKKDNNDSDEIRNLKKCIDEENLKLSILEKKINEKEKEIEITEKKKDSIREKNRRMLYIKQTIMSLQKRLKNDEKMLDVKGKRSYAIKNIVEVSKVKADQLIKLINKERIVFLNKYLNCIIEKTRIFNNLKKIKKAYHIVSKIYKTKKLDQSNILKNNERLEKFIEEKESLISKIKEKYKSLENEYTNNYNKLIYNNEYNIESLLLLYNNNKKRITSFVEENKRLYEIKKSELTLLCGEDCEKIKRVREGKNYAAQQIVTNELSIQLLENKMKELNSLHEELIEKERIYDKICQEVKAKKFMWLAKVNKCINALNQRFKIFIKLINENYGGAILLKKYCSVAEEENKSDDILLHEEEEETEIQRIEQICNDNKKTKKMNNNFDIFEANNDNSSIISNEIESYKILLYVKYRADSPLIMLKSSQQSGGEKGIATIVYILCLQTINPCNFRLVDEINQGLDSYNESNLFKLIYCISNPHYEEFLFDYLKKKNYNDKSDLDIICQMLNDNNNYWCKNCKDISKKKKNCKLNQYFIFTPQMLHNVDYNYMTLHFPFNFKFSNRNAILNSSQSELLSSSFSLKQQLELLQEHSHT